VRLVIKSETGILLFSYYLFLKQVAIVALLMSSNVFHLDIAAEGKVYIDYSHLLYILRYKC